MSNQLVAEGYDAASLSDQLASLQDGEFAEVRLFVDNPPSEYDLQELQIAFEQAGAILTEPIGYDAGIISIKFINSSTPQQIGLLPLLIIPATILGTGFFAWQMTKEVKETTQAIPNIAYILGGVALVGVVLIFMGRKQPKQIET